MTNEQLEAFLQKYPKCRPEGLFLDDDQWWLRRKCGVSWMKDREVHSLIESAVMDAMGERGIDLVWLGKNERGWLAMRNGEQHLRDRKPTRLAAVVSAYGSETNTKDNADGN
jgi:hypothetical protein